jgi:hypothetical protein
LPWIETNNCPGSLKAFRRRSSGFGTVSKHGYGSLSTDIEVPVV